MACDMPEPCKFCLLTVARRCSCGPTRELILLRIQSLVLWSYVIIFVRHKTSRVRGSCTDQFTMAFPATSPVLQNQAVQAVVYYSVVSMCVLTRRSGPGRRLTQTLSRSLGSFTHYSTHLPVQVEDVTQTFTFTGPIHSLQHALAHIYARSQS